MDTKAASLMHAINIKQSNINLITFKMILRMSSLTGVFTDPELNDLMKQYLKTLEELGVVYNDFVKEDERK